MNNWDGRPLYNHTKPNSIAILRQDNTGWEPIAIWDRDAEMRYISGVGWQTPDTLVRKGWSFVTTLYIEEEMRQAQIDRVDDCMQICDGVYDKSLDDAESKGAMRCADQIEAYKESI